ncbi:hypothetical protein [Salipiger sp.]|uniref:hypothetical protein n=1 Tax=Salipiger sp. TaxID=2078585 RepID=UPI003A96CB59
MSRAFGIISTSIWGSRRFRGLPCELARLVYLYLHTNRHGTSIGAYRLPIAYIATDLRVPEDRANIALAAVVHASLARYDELEEVVSIIGWWDHNPITNRKHLQGAIRAQRELPRTSPAGVVSAVEIAGSALAVARRWATDEKGRRAAAEALEMCREMLLGVVDDHGMPALAAAVQTLPHPLSEELPIALSIDLSIGVNGFRAETETETETQTQTQTETQTETETGKSPLSDEIAALNQRAGARSAR